MSANTVWKRYSLNIFNIILEHSVLGLGLTRGLKKESYPWKGERSWSKDDRNEDKVSFSAADIGCWVKMVIFSMFLTTAWCVESRVAIPDPVHGWLGRMHDSTDRACFCHISTRGDGFGGFVPAAARVPRISWATNPTRGEWGTLAAVEDNLVPAATPCIRLIRDRNEDHKTTFWPDTILAKQFKIFLWRKNVSQTRMSKWTFNELFVGQRMGALAF